MSEQPPSGPDFTQGYKLSQLAEGGAVAGQVQGEAVVLVRKGEGALAIGASCTHYGGPLAEGLVVGDEIRCPWHHACFDLNTGEARHAPALKPLPCWRVERKGDLVFVRERREGPVPGTPPAPPRSVVIVGGGAAGHAAAETLRKEGYRGPLTMISADDSPPVDRPNLSKDFLAGTAPDEWLPLREPSFFAEQQIELRLKTQVASIDPAAGQVRLGDGSTVGYDALLLATGAQPVKLEVPGADGAQVHYLRSLADSQRLVAAAGKAKRAVVVGAGFIGLEVAASLRARGLEVTVVAPAARPLERVLGRELADFIRSLHEEHGVVFKLGGNVKSIAQDAVVLDDGARLSADLVVVGIGVRPQVQLAEQAGLRTDKGVLVDEYLATSAPGIWAAGDLARWPYRGSAAPVRIEHWVVAERQGQAAARNILGKKQPFHSVPFFWSQHYDVQISYVGYADSPDEREVRGSIQGRDCLVAYRRGGKTVAVASIGRDHDSLMAEQLIAVDDQAGLQKLLASLPLQT